MLDALPRHSADCAIKKGSMVSHHGEFQSKKPIISKMTIRYSQQSRDLEKKVTEKRGDSEA
jgi:hypothetical protein